LLVVPVQALAVGSLICFVISFVVRPVPPYSLDVVVMAAVALVCTGGLTLRQRRRLRLRSTGALARPTRWRRTAHVVAVIAVIAVLGAATAGGIAAAAAASRLPDRSSPPPPRGAISPRAAPTTAH
jgi:hypothetical protein